MSITSFDLNQLLVLHTVLAERSVAGAARRLHVTPSAVSNTLAKLRAELGDALVMRHGRGLALTPRARELEPILARAIGELDQAVTRGPFVAENCTRTFTLAMADALQVAWLPGIAAKLAGAMPRARLRVVGIETLLSLGDLGSGEVDLHVGVRATGAGIHSEAVYEERTVLVGRSGNRACRGKLSHERLAALGHVGVELAPGRGFRDPVAAAYARARVERRVALTVSSFAAGMAVAAGTDLVVTLPLSLQVAQGKRLGLTELRGPIPRHHVAMAMCWHERTHADPATVAFRKLVRAALGG